MFARVFCSYLAREARTRIRSHADRPASFLALLAMNANFIEYKFQLLKQCARQQLAEDFDITEMKKHMNCINPYNILKESIFHLVLRLRGALPIFLKSLMELEDHPRCRGV